MDDDIFKKLGIDPNKFDSILKIAKRNQNMVNYSIPEYKTPNISIPELPRIPTSEEQNDYQSADVLVRRLANTVLKWKESLDDELQPAILAILSGGIQIQVNSLAVEGFHGIRIDGTLNGDPCMMLTHQASAQLLCYAVEVTEEKPRRGIGFILSDNERLST